MKTCPEQIELYAFVDGELPREQWLVIDAHLPQCSRCRDEIRGIARLNRCLHDRLDVPDLSDDFEQNFRAALLSRTITSNEVKAFRRVLEMKKVVYLAAGFVLAVVVWQLFSHEDSKTEPVSAEVQARTEESARDGELTDLALDRLVAAVITADSKADEKDVRDIQDRFARNGESLVGNIGKRLSTATSAEERAFYAILAESGSKQAQLLLSRRLKQQAPRSPMRKAILEAVVRFPDQATARLIAAESRRGLHLEQAFDLLVRLPLSVSWGEVTALCRRHVKDDPKTVIELLTSVDDERAESFLLDLHLGGLQSSGLTAHLVKRRKVMERSRALVVTQEASVSHKKLAMRLLAEKGDEESEGVLAGLVDDPRLGDDAIFALASMGTEDAMVRVVHRLPLGRMNPLSSKTRKEREQVENAVAAMGEAGLALMTRLVHLENHSHRAHYVQALGILGNADTLPLIYNLADNSELKESALRAVLRIGSPASLEFLKKMSRDQNHEIRRLARRGLKKLRLNSKNQKWKGFACSGSPSCGNSPRMV